ncbi:hypothetical protein SteCoe_28972 [Stentor coeruleus]|uniref:Uncharacterized protein n=1 Tax=Stentor coeruleus TaxID=5963 RepID=A0A1R2B737_9CILI|nr:hypothetical protein SteCoe_28972 [Stentor coeruleus]
MKPLLLVTIFILIAAFLYIINVYAIINYFDIEKVQVSNPIYSDDLPIKVIIQSIPKTNETVFEIKNKLSLNRKNKPFASNNKSCIPIYYGISPEHDLMYFKPKKKFSCPSLKSQAKLQFTSNTTKLTCPNTGSIYIGGSISEEYYGSYGFFDYWRPYQGEVFSPTSEFAYAKCNNENLAILRNKYNSTSANRAKSITETISKSKNLSDTRPLSVMVLILDSLSRQNFYRFLEQTKKLFEEYLLTDKFYLYDFMLNNAEDSTTVPNLSALLTGYRIDYFDQFNLSLKIKTDWPKFEALQNKTALWKYFERQGFVTMFLGETSNNFLSKITGNKILTDHVVANFWRVAAKSTKFKEFAVGNQCIGSMPPHEYSLKYIKEFFTNYKGINRFAYAQINTAHEETCTRISTIDKPLSNMISDTLEFANTNNEDFIMIVAGDHGRYYKALTLESFSEKMLPVHFLIASKSIIEKFNVDQNLVINENMLISRLDWYATIKHMANFPYMTGPPTNIEMQEFYDALPEQRGKDIFFEKLDEKRNCKSLGISDKACLCDKGTFTNEPISSEFKNIVSKTVTNLNILIKTGNLEKKCKLITDYQISEILKIVKPSKENLENYFIKLLVPDTIFDEYENSENITHNIDIQIYVPYKDALKYNYNKNSVLSRRTELLNSINKELETSIKTVYDVVLYLAYEEIIKPKINTNLINNVCIPEIKKIIVEGQNENSCSKVCEVRKYFCINKILSVDTLDFIEKKYLDSEGKYKEFKKEIQGNYKQKCERIFSYSSILCECFSS